jgi:aspartyl aminopeptidase
MKQEKLFDLLKAAVSPCECVKAAKQAVNVEVVK